MNTLPAYFLRPPEADTGMETVTAFEKLFAESVADGIGATIDYKLDAPKWQFLSYLCANKRIIVHGSGNNEISEFEPRKSNDVNEFGNRQAIYAASDGIWAIYFAIVNRQYVTSLINGCFQVVTPSGSSEPYYYFSINADAVPHNPWRDGVIYILPRESFERQPLQTFRGMDIQTAQWASSAPVKPFAKLSVAPTDFPFLEQMRFHDPAVLGERAAANPDGFPWLDGQ